MLFLQCLSCLHSLTAPSLVKAPGWCESHWVRPSKRPYPRLVATSYSSSVTEILCQAWGGHLARGPQGRTVSRKRVSLGKPHPRQSAGSLSIASLATGKAGSWVPTMGAKWDPIAESGQNLGNCILETRYMWYVDLGCSQQDKCKRHQPESRQGASPLCPPLK